MTFYFLILFGLYFVLLMVLRIGWSKAIAQKKITPVSKNLFISVVIPIRNEEKNIDILVQYLANQNYPSQNFEAIFVNDHSTDSSAQLIEQRKMLLPNATVISLENKFGKKAALTQGIYLAKGEIIVTTDADCIFSADWLTTINSVFQDQRTNMGAGMVSIVSDDKFFSQWQAMEFASVMGTGAAAFGLGQPMICNGANLSFRKKVFEEVKGYEGNEHIASGDDEFLMRKIILKHPQSIRLLISRESIVPTQFQPSIKYFLQQRLRWAGKWKVNPSVGTRLFAVFIFIVQISWIVFCTSAFNYEFSIALLILALKLVADLLFLLPVFRFFKIRFRLLPFLGLQFLYPFYVLFIGIFSQWKSYEWKGRRM